MVHRFYFYDSSVSSATVFSYDVVDVDLTAVLSALDTVLYLTLESYSSYVITRTVLNNESIVNIVFDLRGGNFHKAVNIVDSYLTLRGLELVV